MGHCYGNDLRRRVVEAVTGGLSARGAAARFRVAPATAIHWRRRWRETGSIEPDRQGQPLSEVIHWLHRRTSPADRLNHGL